MSLGNISDATISSWLTSLKSSARYASVHFETPSWLDPGASEVFNPGYSRQLVTWSDESSRGITTATPLVFPAMPVMTVAAIGLWTELVSGTMVAYAASQPGDEIYVTSIGTLTIAANEVAIRLP